MKRQLSIALVKYGIGLGLLAFMIWRNWQPPSGIGIADALRMPLQIGPLLAAVLILTASVLLTFTRWYILVRAQELPFTLWNGLRLGWMGFFFSTFLPGSVGGDLFKAAFIAREQSRRTVAVATVVIDRIIGLWGLFWLVVLSGAIFWLVDEPALRENAVLQAVVFGSAGICAASVLIWLVSGILTEAQSARFADSLTRWLPKVGGIAAELWRALWLYRCRGKIVVLTLLMSLVGHVGFVLTFFYATRTFLQPDQVSTLPTLAENFLLVPVGMTIQAGFPTPGGLGGGEAAFGWLFAATGSAEATGVLAALVTRMIYWCLAFAGYFAYAGIKPASPDNQRVSETSSFVQTLHRCALR
ncbi:MAG: hypothetical protein KatS3mg105_1550 [Gemmatales bacterium]|nr:MAG: hypothetical protein KatS3mg105_1550 [Gemmatales bacterium]